MMLWNSTNNSLENSEKDHYVKNIALMLNLRLQLALLPVIIFLGIVAFIGVFGNVLILIIYGRRREGGNFRCFVLMMATIDLTSCITTVATEIYSLLNWYDSPYIWVCKANIFSNVLTYWGSVWMLILLAIDRYRKICRPLRWQIRTSLAMKLCIIALIFSATAATWVTMLWGKHMYEHSVNESVSVNVSVCEKNEIVYKVKGNHSIGFVFVVPMGFLLLVALCLNSITSITLFRQRAKFRTPSKAHDVVSEPASVRTDVSVDTQNASLSGGAQFTSLPDFADQLPESFTQNFVRRNSANKSPTFSIKTINVSCKRQDTLFSRFLGRRTYNTAAVHRKSNTIASNEITLRSTADRVERFQRMKQKTIIMLVLTVTFVVTMFLKAVLVTYNTVDVLNEKPDVDKVLFFFFLRLYFINRIVNIFVYGILDSRFRNDLVNIWKKILHH